MKKKFNQEIFIKDCFWDYLFYKKRQLDEHDYKIRLFKRYAYYIIVFLASQILSEPRKRIFYQTVVYKKNINEINDGQSYQNKAQLLKKSFKAINKAIKETGLYDILMEAYEKT